MWQNLKNTGEKLNKPLLLKVLFGVFLLSVLAGLTLFFIRTGKQSKHENSQLPSVKIAPEHIWLNDEPLPLPPIQFSREQKKVWTTEDIEKFFIEPNEAVLDTLHEKNSEKIKQLLEGIK